MKITCSKCGGDHEITELAWHFDAPAVWHEVTAEERELSTLTPDQCELVIDGTLHYFIHALLQIPVFGEKEPFVWGVWCSISESSHLEICAMWDSPERTSIGPHFGWLCNRVPGYPDSLHLKTLVHQRGVGLRPTVELEGTTHPLAVDQRNGISADRLADIVADMNHQS